MPSEVKQSIRARQAELTRNAILEAARELFAANGYVPTTIEQVANRAGVGVSTVYAVFGNKSALLAAIRWQVVTSSEVPRLEELIEDDAEAGRRISATISRFRRLYESAPDVFAVQRAAAAVDPALAANWADASAQRHAHMRRILAPVAAQLALPLGRAADVLDAMLAFELYDQLVTRSKWPADEYERWLVATLTAQLVAG